MAQDTLTLTNEDKKLIMEARKQKMQNLTAEQKRAVLKYKKIMAMQKEAQESKEEMPPAKPQPKKQDDLTLTNEDKKLIMEARKQKMQNLTAEQKRAVLKYKKIMAMQKEAQESKEANKPQPKKEQKSEEKLPKKLVLPVIAKPIPDIPSVKREHFAHFKGKNILIAEDNPLNQKMLLAILKPSGINVDVAPHGKEAVDMVKSKKSYDLILMDIEMPQMDGIEATKQIRQDSSFDTLPIVALTSSTEPHEVKNMLEVGMNAYLSKPVVLGKLYNVFRLFLLKK